MKGQSNPIKFTMYSTISPVEPQHKRKVGYKCNFFAEYDSLGVADSKSGGCHFGTLGQFF